MKIGGIQKVFLIKILKKIDKFLRQIEEIRPRSEKKDDPRCHKVSEDQHRRRQIFVLLRLLLLSPPQGCGKVPEKTELMQKKLIYERTLLKSNPLHKI